MSTKKINVYLVIAFFEKIWVADNNLKPIVIKIYYSSGWAYEKFIFDIIMT